MPAMKPVIVYGASGFSGRLVAEYLREYNVPFIAAGRNRARIEEVMKRVPGIETADYEVAEVGSSVDELAKLFSGAKVVCNTVGPFIYSGPRVIEACLKSGCHYLDIKGTYEGCCSQLRSPRTRNYMLGMALWAGARLGVEPVGWLIDQVNIF